MIKKEQRDSSSDKDEEAYDPRFELNQNINKRKSGVNNSSVNALRSGINISVRTQSQNVSAANGFRSGTQVQQPSYLKTIQNTVEMTQNKKVNAQNAFEVDLSCLDNIKEYVNSLKANVKWLRSGEAVNAGAKVYGYRVDNVHSETNRLLYGMHRGAGLQEQIPIIGGNDQENYDPNEYSGNQFENHQSLKQKRQQRNLKMGQIGDDYLSSNTIMQQGLSTLEKPESITTEQFDTTQSVDPLFRQTTKMFDELSLCTLMSSQLMVTPELVLQIDTKIAQQAQEEIKQREKSENQVSKLVNRFEATDDQVAKEIREFLEGQKLVAPVLHNFISSLDYVCQQLNINAEHNKNQVNQSYDQVSDHADFPDPLGNMIGEQAEHQVVEQQSHYPSNALQEDEYQHPQPNLNDLLPPEQPYEEHNEEQFQEPQIDNFLVEDNSNHPEAYAFVNSQAPQLRKNSQAIGDAVNTFDLAGCTQLNVVYTDENEYEQFVDSQMGNEFSQNTQNAKLMQQMLEPSLGQDLQQLLGIMKGLGSQSQSQNPSAVQSNRMSICPSAKTKNSTKFMDPTSGDVSCEKQVGLKEYLTSCRDFSVLQSSKLTKLTATQTTPSVQSPFYQSFSNTLSKGKPQKTTVAQRRKEDSNLLEAVKANFQLKQKDQQGNKLATQLKQARLKAANGLNNGAQTKGNNLSQLTVQQVEKMKDRGVIPYHFSMNLNQLTQLFLRPLQMKYYKNPTREQIQQQQKVEQEEQYMNEEGDILGELVKEENNCFNSHKSQDQDYFDPDDQIQPEELAADNYEVGFADVEVFNQNNSINNPDDLNNFAGIIAKRGQDD